MKNFLLASFLLFTAATGADAQDWTHIASGTMQTLRAVAFSGATGYAVGDSGTILKKTNLASPWVPIPSGTTRNLNAVKFRGTVGYVVGDQGTVLRTGDAGANWKVVSSGTTRNLRGLWFNSYTTVFSPTIYTSDIVGDSGTFLEIDDTTVAAHPFLPGILPRLNSVIFINSTGYIVGDGGKILRTRPQGWVSMESGTTQDLYAVDSYMDLVYAVGSGGTILKLQDTGSGVWNPTFSGISRSLRAVAAQEYGVIHVLGDTGNLLKGYRDEEVWWHKGIDVSANLYGIALNPSSRTMVAVGEGGVILESPAISTSPTFSSPTPTYTVGIEIPPDTLRTAFVPRAYLVYPDLPSGLKIDSNGILTGTPQVQKKTEYYFLAKNLKVDEVGRTTIRVNPAPLKVGADSPRNSAFGLHRTFKGMRLTYTLASPSPSSLRLLDLQGREIWKAISLRETAGEHSVELPLAALKGSMYLLDFRAGVMKKTLRLVAD